MTHCGYVEQVIFISSYAGCYWKRLQSHCKHETPFKFWRNSTGEKKKGFWKRLKIKCNILQYGFCRKYSGLRVRYIFKCEQNSLFQRSFIPTQKKGWPSQENPSVHFHQIWCFYYWGKESIQPRRQNTCCEAHAGKTHQLVVQTLWTEPDPEKPLLQGDVGISHFSLAA